MPLIVETGSVVLNNTTGAQTVNLSKFAGETPKALLVFSTSNGGNGNDAYFVCGMASSSAAQGVICCADRDGVASTLNRARHGNTRVFQRVTHSGSLVEDVTFSSFGVNQFTVTINTADTNNPSTMRYTVLGGSDLTNALAYNWGAPGSPGDQARTGIGFKPDAGICMWSEQSGFNSTTNGYSPGIAFWGPTVRRFWGFRGRNAQSTTDTYNDSSSGEAIRMISSASTLRCLATLKSWDPDGFTLNFTTTTSRMMTVLLLKGGQYAAGHFDSPTLATPPNRTVTTAIGFPGLGVVLGSNSETWATLGNAHVRSMMGASDGTSHQCSSLTSEDNLSVSATTRNGVATHSVHLRNPSGTLLESATTSFSGNDMVTTFDLSDTTARGIAWFAMGSAAPGGVTVDCGIAQATFSAIDPTVQLGSLSLSMGVAQATFSTVDPTTALGSLSLPMGVAELTASAIDPQIALSSVTASAGVAGATLSTIDPAVQIGSTTAVAGVAETTLSTIDPGVVLGSVVLAMGEAQATLSTIDPTVEITGAIFPGTATTTLSTIDPSVALSSLSVDAGIASATLSAIDPLAILGSVSVSPQEATTTLSTVDPAVSTGPVVAGVATVALSTVDPAVVQGSLSLAMGSATTVLTTLDPQVRLGSVSTSPGAATVTMSAVDPAVSIVTPVSFPTTVTPFVAGIDLLQPHPHSQTSSMISEITWLPVWTSSAWVTITSVKDGNWNDPTVWTPARVPNATDGVRINHKVTVTTTGAICSTCAVSYNPRGRLIFSRAADTSLAFVTLYVAGELDCGWSNTARGEGSSIQTRNVELICRDHTFLKGAIGRPDAGREDSSEYGGGIVIVGTAEVYFHGIPTLSYARQTHDLAAGATSVTLDKPLTNWKVGDLIRFPTSRRVTNQMANKSWDGQQQREERTILTINHQTRTITFAPLTHPHNGVTHTSAHGSWTFYPHVLHFTRNITIRSEFDYQSQQNPGHVLITGSCYTEFHNVCFKNMSRTRSIAIDAAAFNTTNGNVTKFGTNQIARYALHYHHCGGRRSLAAAGYQYQHEMTGLSFDMGMSGPPLYNNNNPILDGFHNRKWFVAIHDTHWTRLANCVGWNCAGAGFVYEDGSETENVAEDSHASNCYSIDTTNRFSQENVNGVSIKTARDPGGFWTKGAQQRFRRISASDCHAPTTRDTAFGVKIMQEDTPGAIRMPNQRGQIAAQGSLKQLTEMPPLEFTDMEIYSCDNGFTAWWIGAEGQATRIAPGTWSYFTNIHTWNTGRSVFYYPSAYLRYVGLVSINDAKGFDVADYYGDTVQVLNAYMVNSAINAPSWGKNESLVANCYVTQPTGGSYQCVRHTSQNLTKLTPRTVRFKDNVSDGSLFDYMVYDTIGAAFKFSTRHRCEVFVETNGFQYELFSKGSGHPQVTSQERDAPCLHASQNSVLDEGAYEVGLSNFNHWSKYQVGGALKPGWPDPNTPGAATYNRYYLASQTTSPPFATNAAVVALGPTGVSVQAGVATVTLSAVDPAVRLGSISLAMGVAPATFSTRPPSVIVSASGVDIDAGEAIVAMSVVDPAVELSSVSLSMGIAETSLSALGGTVVVDSLTLQAGVATTTFSTAGPAVHYGDTDEFMGRATVTLTTVPPAIIDPSANLINAGLAEVTLTALGPAVSQASLALQAGAAVVTMSALDPTPRLGDATASPGVAQVGLSALGPKIGQTVPTSRRIELVADLTVIRLTVDGRSIDLDDTGSARLED